MFLHAFLKWSRNWDPGNILALMPVLFEFSSCEMRWPGRYPPPGSLIPGWPGGEPRVGHIAQQWLKSGLPVAPRADSPIAVSKDRLGRWTPGEESSRRPPCGWKSSPKSQEDLQITWASALFCLCQIASPSLLSSARSIPGPSKLSSRKLWELI